MLYLIGLGLHDERDLSLKAIDAIKGCEKVYIETFTGDWHGDLNKLTSITGKKIIRLDRERVESDFLVSEARKNSVALLVPGDPLTATVHFELFLEAKKEKIPAEIIHAPSIYTAVAETGLHIYKFGRTTTLPRPQKNFNPNSPIEIINENKEAGLHSLILLDTEMTAKDGLELLYNNGFEEAIVCCNLGGDDRIIRYGAVSDLLHEELNKSPSALIVTGKLNFKEEEALELWK